MEKQRVELRSVVSETILNFSTILITYIREEKRRGKKSCEEVKE